MRSIACCAAIAALALACQDEKPTPELEAPSPGQALAEVEKKVEKKAAADDKAEPVAMKKTVEAVALPPLTVLTEEFGKEEDDKTGDKVVLFLQGEIYTTCNGLSLPTPNFPLDSAKPKYEDADELRNLAKCLLTDAFDDATVTLVGRTDPRGDRTYNKALGAKRAATVERILTVHGVDPKRIKTISAGEPQPGTDLRSYDDARRVDVMLTRPLLPR